MVINWALNAGGVGHHQKEARSTMCVGCDGIEMHLTNEKF